MSEAEESADNISALAHEVVELEERVAELESNLRIQEPEIGIVDENTEHRTRAKGVKQAIELVETFSEDGAALQDVYSITGILGIEYEVAKGHVEDLRRQGEIYNYTSEGVKTT